MPIPAGPGGQREAWRGPGAAAGLFWRPVTLAQIPPRPQECRSLPSPPPCTPPRPPRQSPGESQREPASEQRQSQRGSERGAKPAGLQRGSRARVRGTHAGQRLDGRRGPRGRGAETYKYPHSDSHTLPAHSWTGRQDTRGDQETRGGPRRGAEVGVALAPEGALDQPAARRLWGPFGRSGSWPARGAEEKTEAGPPGSHTKLMSLIVTKKPHRAVGAPTDRLTQTQTPRPAILCLPPPSSRSR